MSEVAPAPGRAAHAFDLASTINTLGGPLFALFAKGGYHGRRQRTAHGIGSIVPALAKTARVDWIRAKAGFDPVILV